MRPEQTFLAEVPHPLEPGKKVIVGSQDSLRRCFQRVFTLRRASERPSLLYQVVSFSPDEETPERVHRYEQNLFSQWQREYQSSLGRDLLTLVFFVLLSYTIWNIGFIFQAVDTLFMLAGDYLNPYARVVLILAPLIYVVYHKLLVGNTVFAKKRAFAFLNLQSYLESSAKADFEKDLKGFIGRSTELCRKALLSLLDALQRGDEKAMQHCLWELRRLSLPLGEAQQVAALCNELEFLLQGKFSHRMCRVEYSEDLERFFSSPAYQSLTAEIRRCVAELPRSSEALTETLSLLGQTLCRDVRGKIREEVLEAMLEYYRGIQQALLTSSKRFKLSLEPFEPPLRTHLRPSLPQAGFISLLMVALSLFLFSIHLVGREDFLIVRRFEVGWQGFIGERLEIVDHGIPLGTRKLLLTTPRPFAFAHRATLRPQSVEAFLLIREVEPSPQGGILGMLRYLWDKGMAFFKEGYGNDFVILRFSFTFEIADPEKWKKYDFDGRGKERLSRDLESYLLSYTDRVREKYRQAFFEEEYEQARTKLEEVSRSRTFREWIRRFLYPSPLDTYRVGSVYDMYLLGLEWLRRHPHMENNPEWKTFVDHEMALIRDKMRQEHDELIANPLRVRDMVRNPSVFEFSEYPGLYQTLLVMAMNEVITNEFLEDLKKGDYRKTLEEETLQYVKEQGTLFSNIGVTLLETHTSLERVSYLYYLRYLQKRQNLL